VSGGRELTPALSDVQVARVVREASGRTGLAPLLSGVGELQELRRVLMPLWDDVRCSRSLIRALWVLAAFPVDGRQHELREIAREIGFSPSTTHRYVRIWVAVGLQQYLRSRRHHRALADALAASARQPVIGRAGDAS
jgi:AraC-like DNA-binding protein